MLKSNRSKNCEIFSKWQLATLKQPTLLLSVEWQRDGMQWWKNQERAVRSPEQCTFLILLFKSLFSLDTFTLAALFSFSAAAPKTTMTRTKDMKNSIPKPCTMWTVCKKGGGEWSHLSEGDTVTKLSWSKTALAPSVIRHQALEKGGTQLKWNSNRRRNFLKDKFPTKPPRLCATT